MDGVKKSLCSLILTVAFVLAEHSLAEVLKCFKCSVSIEKYVVDNKSITTPLCSQFQKSSNYIVPCPYSTMCLKSISILRLQNGQNQEAVTRGCAQQKNTTQKAYGDAVLSRTRAFEWYKAFQEGRKILEDMPRSGRPSTSLTDTNIDAVKEFIFENHHVSLREIAQVLNISHESIRTILTDRLGMKRVAARLVPMRRRIELPLSTNTRSKTR
ncbi:uncharacterized protein LOC108100612 [Drosophila ficusphila]|uniref:uncharacterized protein LOC108100612 n=1 Tax=Drosophila ficusphila TaxID=30025 RepID=UPI001C8A3D50|nr:uncharacterized protein LOC108100612 [Drosophila ficusphila]XP_043064449.1 uncharacterized protein LOC108100612 [Drosophila ficusphila]XP_043064450.1 uncharacterized protein LOC108100612 [Drosophila ficusphila]XP_043064451.1 uncharacterized protein LOC108100612 [Drosophila ficusphila]